MRRYRGLILVLIMVSVVIFFGLQTTNASVGNLQVYKGSATLVRAGQTSSGTSGAAVKLHDSLKVAPDSTVAIVLKDSSVIRLEAGSEAEVAELDYEGTKIKKAVLKLKYGRLWSRVAPLEAQGQFEVETPTAVAAVQGTNFNTTYKDAFSGIYVYHDIVRVALLGSRDKTRPVHPGELLRMHDATLTEDFASGPKPPSPDFFDAWILFNQAEDDKICHDNPQTPGCDAATVPTPTITLSLPAITLTSPVLSPTPFATTPKIKVTAAAIKPPRPASPTSRPTPSPTPTKKLSSLSLAVADMVVPHHGSTSVKVMAKYSDNSSTDVTSQVKWTQEPTLGTISGTTFTGDTVGKTILKANLSGIASNDVGIEVQKQVTSFRFTSSVDNVKRVAYIKATAIYSDNSPSEDVTPLATWEVVKPTNLKRTISSGVLPLGANDPWGTYTVSCTYRGKTETTDVTFTSPLR